MDSLIAADNAQDRAAVLRNYADDIVFLPPTGELVSGKAAVSRRYESLFATFHVALTTRIDDVRVGGDLAIVRGLNAGVLKPRAGGTPTAIHDNYLAVLACQSASWRITHLMWSKIPIPAATPVGP